MATEEEESDVSLKEIVQQTLEARGLFASIRAQLLASVFEVFEDSSNSDPINPTLHRFLSSSNGRLLLSLVKEFLDFFCLEASSSVLVTETAFQDFETREQLCGAFHLDNEGVDDDLDSVPLLQYLVEGRRGGGGGVGSIDDSGASASRRGAPIPFTISTPIQPPAPKSGFSSSRGFDDSSNHSNGPSSASPSLDLGPANGALLKESNFSNHSTTSSNAAAAAAKTSKIPVPSSPTSTTTSNPSSNGGAKKENFFKESSPSGIPRVKSSSSVSSNSSSSGSDRAATPKVSNDDDHIKKTTKNGGNSSHSNSQKETTAKMNGFYVDDDDDDDNDNSSPHHQNKKASHNDKVKPGKSVTKDNDDDFDLGDFVTNNDDFYDDDDDLFGLGVGKKDKKNERHTSFPSRRRQDEGGGGGGGGLSSSSKKGQSKSDDDKKSEKNGNDFLSDLPPLKSSSADQNKKGKEGRSDWLDELGFGNDDAFGGGGGSGSDNNNKSESSSRRLGKSDATESSKGKLSAQKDNNNAQRRNNNNGAAFDGQAKGKNLIGGGAKDFAMGSKTVPTTSKERKKTFDSNSEVSEIAESVEEFSFESDEDITTDKTFSDPDNALKKLDYTENVGAVIYETL